MRVSTYWVAVAAILLASGVSVAADAPDLRLVAAAKAQEKQTVRALLAQHVDVNVPQGDGATALHWAAHWDNLETADLLLRSGANVNASNDNGVTPLSLACTNARAAMVARLLAAGANPNAARTTGETVLMTASRTGNLEVVNALLTRGVRVNDTEPSRGQTALMWAAAQGHPEVVRTLIEHGADVNGRSGIRNRLISRGNPIGNGIGNGSGIGAVIAEMPKGGFTPLLFAARQGDVESARHLLAAGANANDTAPDGMSALVVAVFSGHGELASFLLESGADPNAADVGYAALHAAVLRGDLALVKALLARGADPNIRLTKGSPVTREGNGYALGEHLVGSTPFLLAAKFAELEMMRVLAAAGALPNAAKHDGTTPLMLAAGMAWGNGADRRERRILLLQSTVAEDEARTLEAVRTAVELGADVNPANESGDTALHAAATKGYNSVVKFLAEHGARLDVKNKRGLTPLGVTSGGQQTAESTSTGGVITTADLLRQLGAKE